MNEPTITKTVSGERLIFGGCDDPDCLTVRSKAAEELEQLQAQNAQLREALIAAIFSVKSLTGAIKIQPGSPLHRWEKALSATPAKEMVEKLPLMSIDDGTTIAKAGAVCGDCGFQYFQHRGHIVPCPLCARDQARAELAERDKPPRL